MVKYLGFMVFIIYSILLFILVFNMHKKNNIIKYGSIILFVILLIVLIFSNESIVNTLLTSLVSYIYFPSFTSYVITMVLTLGVLVYSIFNENLCDKVRIINYVFSSLMIVSYVIFLLLEVDVLSYNMLYDGESLLCIRYTTRTFTLWVIIISVIKYFQYFLKKRW